jgi:hypothetical protein
MTDRIERATPGPDPVPAEQHSHHDSRYRPVDFEVVRARHELIKREAPCVGCGATLEDCKAHRGEGPTAPPWFGCCAQGTAMAPCSHRTDQDALDALLAEVVSGQVRTVDAVLAERTERASRAERLRGPLTGPIVDQGEWWRQRDGSFVRIADMTPGHRYNSAAMLMRGAPVAALKYALNFRISIPSPDDVGDMTMDSLEREAAEVDAATGDPATWLRETALYRALTAGLAVRGDGTQPWQATGRDPVTGKKTKVPPAMVQSCEIPACGCSGEAHA